MSELLIKIFIKDYENTSSSVVREKYGLLGSVVAILLNILLFLAKYFLGFITKSIAITADAFNNLSDVASGVATLISFKIASMPADKDHPFGHGRIEYLCGLIITALILVVGFEVVKSSIIKIISPTPIIANKYIVLALLLSILVKLWMSLFYKKLGNKINSIAMKAAAQDSRNDSLTTLATTIGIFLSMFFSFNFDGFLGLFAGIFILFSGYKMAMETISPLLGNRPDEELIKEVNEIVLNHEMVSGIHDLIIHDYGPGRRIGSAHVEVPIHCDILKAHDEIDNAEKLIQSRLNMSFTIHLDPVQTDCEKTNILKKQVLDVLHSINDKMSLHDFRVVSGPTHTNLIFDVLIPYGYKEKHSVLKAKIDDEIKKMDNNYYTVITFDDSYI